MTTPSTYICSKQPFGVKENSTFIVNCDKLAHRDDIRTDDLGVWKNGGVKSIYCIVNLNGEGAPRRITKLSSKPSVMRHSVYRLRGHIGTIQKIKPFVDD